MYTRAWSLAKIRLKRLKADQQRNEYYFMNIKPLPLALSLCVLLLSLWAVVFMVRTELYTPVSAEDQPQPAINQLVANNAAPADTVQASATPSQPVRVQKEDVIYADTLAEAWQEWSWSVSSQPASAAPVHNGSAAFAVTYDAGWGAFYLHTDEFRMTNEYDLLRFWIHGGDAGGQRTRVVLADESTSFLAESKEVVAQADTWTLVEIKLADLGMPRQISGIVWQDATGNPQPTFYIDDLALVDLDLPPTPTPAPVAGPLLSVNLQAAGHPINPDIYGINYADEALATVLNLPVRRWGGNATTRYNWQNDTTNRASDWFFENIPEENEDPSTLPDGSAADRFIEQDLRTGTKTVMTMPMIGWTAKSREFSCGFSVAQYGPQQQTDSWQPDCGNGLDANGDPLTGNDPTDTSMAIDPSFVQEWMTHLIARFGTAAEGGVAYYNLDNEPMLWHHTHRDIHPEPVGYDELRDLTYAYAAAIKEIDPTAQTLGPAEWGWTAYFFSALDSAAGDNWWNKAPDRADHDDLPLTVWYLQQMALYEKEHGVRILDYLDLHYYPQASGVALAPLGDTATRALRLRSTRSLWDATYQDESWIDEPVRLIPLMREWVDEYYPGTKLAIGEYNWGALDHMNGALAQADVLGIFGREGLDMALLWAALEVDDPFAFAFRMYRNYDGANSIFGDSSLQATSKDQEKLAIYAAQRSSDSAVTLMVINKSNDALISKLTLQGLNGPTTAQVFRYGVDDVTTIQTLPDQAVTGTGWQATFPAQSITLFVLPPARENSASAPASILRPTATP